MTILLFDHALHIEPRSWSAPRFNWRLGLAVAADLLLWGGILKLAF